MGGGEKDCFTMQLTVAKDGTKLKPYVIFKGASFNGAREHRRRTVTHELYHRLEDNAGNFYPPEEKIYLTYSAFIQSLYLKDDHHQTIDYRMRNN